LREDLALEGEETLGFEGALGRTVGGLDLGRTLLGLALVFWRHFESGE
jgi:hypothetical protein